MGLFIQNPQVLESIVTSGAQHKVGGIVGDVENLRRNVINHGSIDGQEGHLGICAEYMLQM